MTVNMSVSVACEVQGTGKFFKVFSDTISSFFQGLLAHFLFPRVFLCQNGCSVTPTCVNPLPHMPILGSSNSTANKDMMSKIWTNGDTISDYVENIVGKEEIAR